MAKDEMIEEISGKDLSPNGEEDMFFYVNGTEEFTEEQKRRMEQAFSDSRDVRDRAEHMEMDEEIVEMGVPTPAPKGADSVTKETVEEKIAKFKLHLEKITAIINQIKSTFILSSDWNIDVSAELRSLSIEIGDLCKEADILIADIESLKIVLGGETLSLDIKEIKKMIKDIKNRLKELKIHHLQLYNARVDMINIMIDEILLDVNLTAEMRAKLEALRMQRIDVIVRSWQHYAYLGQIDFNVFISVIAEIKKIKDITPPNLETDMAFIENEITRLEEFPKDKLSAEEVIALKDDCISVANRINDFRIKLENNRHNISEKDYNNYLDRLNDAEANLALVNSDLKVKLVPGPVPAEEIKIYKELLEKLEELKNVSIYCRNMIEALYGHIDEKGIQAFLVHIDTYERRLEEIKQDIEEKHKAGELDDNQYNELMKKVEEIENILKNAREKVKEPEMIKDVDIFVFLNKKIDGVENALDALEKQVDALEKPIKDKNVRKQIDSIIKKLEQEIKDIEDTLEKYKNENPEKYKETKERLDKAKERLEKVSKNYRKKCPLLVRAVKSAKAFYKKHKKACLIVAGLAAFALVGYHVLIPAIMHGNIMIGTAAPALSGFTNFVNNILGGIVGASKTVNGTWLLANGVRINASRAATSLLKGLAISGIGTTTLVAPIVVAIKKLVEKMNLAELKEKIAKDKEKNKEKEKKEKKPVEKNKTKKADRMSLDELAKLLKEYRKSGKSLDEFCVEYELSEEEKVVIQYLESKSQENKQNLEKSGRKGR
ncbi:MAG: hypothetical protein IJE89_02080 [Bacilli bacterium]|nr:hypothetical protein [Bacilli bacterium]